MIKRIKVEQLRPGMFIHDLNCGWLEHPFMSNRFAVNDAQTVEKVRTLGVREVYIDTDKGWDLPGAPTKEEVLRDTETHLKEVLAPQPHSPEALTVEGEIARARTVHRHARQVVYNVMEDVRLGRQVELDQVEPLVHELIDSIFRNHDALMCLGRVKDKDEYTFLHSVSVCVLMVTFCRSLNVPREVIDQVGMGALLHDVGKMRVPMEILNKPGRLTEEELALMKRHVEFGDELLRQYPGLSEAALEVAAQHHERMDGNGYPGGLRGEQITIFGQMAAIVDVYDAITSNRCYHIGMPVTDALRKLLEWSRFHFNPDLVQKFIRAIGIYPVGTVVKLENGLLGVVTQQRDNLLKPLVRLVLDTRSRTFIPPRDIDLSSAEAHEPGYRIVGEEPARRWLVDPLSYLSA